MTVNCDRCAVYIETDNRRWPGYCSARCRDRDLADKLDRQRELRERWRAKAQVTSA